MDFNRDDLRSGIAEGMKRASTDFHLPHGLANDEEAKLGGVLRSWPTELSDRFVKLFSELATLADAARSANNEPLLNEDELRGFLGHSASFFNSFKHR